MNRAILCGALFLSFSGLGCATRSADETKVEPVRFTHPDEVVKGQGSMVLADRREFAVMALINAMGYDNEAPGQSMHPVRVKVRQLVAQNLAAHPEKSKTWRHYYETRKLATFQYQDYALNLSTNYPFRPIRSDSEHPCFHRKELP